jgi:hypothetical protein
MAIVLHFTYSSALQRPFCELKLAYKKRSDVIIMIQEHSEGSCWLNSRHRNLKKLPKRAQLLDKHKAGTLKETYKIQNKHHQRERKRLRKNNSGIMLRSGVFTMVTMKNVIFWDVTPCGYCWN